MDKRVFFIIALAFINSHGFAQLFDAPFGEFNESELRQLLEMKYYPRDSNANAVVLYEKGTIDMDGDRTKLTHLRRVKVFNSVGVADWSNMHRLVDVRGITSARGICYSLQNGTIIKQVLTKDNIFQTYERRGLTRYSAAMPNVAPGSIIEFEFINTLIDFYTYFDWTFQASVPIVMSEFIATGQRNFNSDVGGVIKPQYNYDKLRGVSRWWFALAPAFHREVLMPHVRLYIASLNTFYSSESWDLQAMSIWKSGSFGGVIRGKPSWQRKADEIVAGLTDPKEKTKAVVSHVKREMTWNGRNDIWSDDIEKALETKSGSCADINLYMISLLKSAGLHVNPVYIQPREYGPYHEHFATLEQFSYVIGQVVAGADTIYVDGTDRLLPYDAVPHRCLNDRGMVLLKRDVKWVNIKPRIRNKVTMESNINVDASGRISGVVLMRAEGYTANNWRRNYYADREKFLASIAKPDWVVSGDSIAKLDEPEHPFVIKFDFHTDAHVNIAGNLMYIEPFAFADTTSLFQADSRRYPVNLVVPQEEVAIFNFSLPENYAVEQLPESKLIALPGNKARAMFNFSTAGERVQLLSRVTVNQPFFEAEEYAALRDLHQRAQSKAKETVVLRKK